jgi:hypothetical protein
VFYFYFYFFFLFLLLSFAGKHPFIGANGNVNVVKVCAGTFEKIDDPEYSDALKDLIYRMMHHVCVLAFVLFHGVCVGGGEETHTFTTAGRCRGGGVSHEL